MGKRTKKFLPWLATGAVCLLAAIALFILLPYLRPSNADNDKTTTTPDRNQQQIDENPSTDDQHNNTDNTTTKPTEPDPAEPIDPEPSEPVDPTPTEPTDPKPTFVLTAENLHGTVWEDAARQLCLTFSDVKKQYTITNSDCTVFAGKWVLDDTTNTVTLKLNSSEEADWVLTYADNKLTVLAYGYTFVWQATNNTQNL